MICTSLCFPYLFFFNCSVLLFVVMLYILIFSSFGIAAIATVVTIAEILKNNGLALEKSETQTSVLLLLATTE